MRAEVVQITYREVLSSVFLTQVATPMGLLAARGWKVSVIAFAALGELVRREHKARLAERRRSLCDAVGAGKATFLASPPARLRGLWRDEWLLRGILRFHGVGQGPVLLHCRNAGATRIACRARRAGVHRIVYDCRGIEDAEKTIGDHSENRTVRDAIRRDREARRVSATHSDAILCVSHAMKRHLCGEFGVAEDRVTVVPCCVDMTRFRGCRETRDAIRRELGFDNRFVWVYCGSDREWQALDVLGRFVRMVLELNADARLLVLTHRPDRFLSMLCRGGVDATRCRALHVPESDVPGYLAAADIGMLLREASIVNVVAAPVKFAEYLAAGLPVVISSDVGDYSQFVRDNNCGFVVPNRHEGQVLFDAERTVMTRIQGWNAAHCRQLAEGHLSWQSQLGRVEEVYERLLTRPDTEDVVRGGRSA